MAWTDCPNCNHTFLPNNPVCPSCFTFLEECSECNEEWQKPNSITCYICKKWKQDKSNQKPEPLWAPSPFAIYDYEMKSVDREHGYDFYFKEGEPKMPNKEPHVHIRGHGREIQYYLSPLRIKKKVPKNFPEGEENKIYKVVKQRWAQYLQEWERIKNS